MNMVERVCTVPDNTTGPSVYLKGGRACVLDVPLPTVCQRADARVSDVLAWDALPIEVRALAFRVLLVAGTAY
jgi:hypothetical protein